MDEEYVAFEACRNGDLETLKQLLREHPEWIHAKNISSSGKERFAITAPHIKGVEIRNIDGLSVKRLLTDERMKGYHSLFFSRMAGTCGSTVSAILQDLSL
ncbi:hypothetical protein [Staphylospora marina]|uniref:hypothetical protein n=1 Tax=Staphylospora marina TaxID=2490858 RepID=UPI000F5BF5D5|nr:hypothetical protein [Staphylospora marina]